ncbi:MAG: hypothetical protein OEZ13_10280 [Spirochaetia bacterium]|nr:hypothetical protein [Spirochaetia bacterium]
MRYRIIVIILGVLLIFSFWDIYDDLYLGFDFSHLFVESLFFIFIGWLFIFFFKTLLNQTRSIEKLKSDNKALKEKSKYWKIKTSKIRSNIRNDIENQLKEWGLTETEITVAFLVIRGYSFMQIANLLKKSERTARQQAIEIYKKSGFNSRAEFTAFFLESIFELEDEEAFFD